MKNACRSGNLEGLEVSAFRNTKLETMKGMKLYKVTVSKQFVVDFIKSTLFYLNNHIGYMFTLVIVIKLISIVLLK